MSKYKEEEELLKYIKRTETQNFSSFLRTFRPDLSPYTIRTYSKHLFYLADAHSTGYEPIDLTSALIDIALETLSLDHITLIGLPYEKNIRIALFRNLILIFKNDITKKNYEILDALILEKRI